jgi:signal transduction histidine kinase
MDKEIRIIMLEDSAADAELELRELRRGGIAHTAIRVETENYFLREMESFSPDLILADYSLPSFDGLTALAMARERLPEIPFIFVTGTMGEEIAIESLKNGATDYVLKQGLNRLVPSIRRALREAEEQRRRREAEGALREETFELLRTLEELREKDQLLMHQSRLAAMGEMINCIAHQWRQPLNTLSMVVQLMQYTYQKGDCTAQFVDDTVEQIMRQIMHMSQTIDDFRNFFRPDRAKSRFGLKETLDKTLLLVGDSFKEQQISVAMLDEEDPYVTGYPNEYSQALLNLLNNARDALTERHVASPRIEIRLFWEGEKAVTTISDNAGGVPEAIIDRIFDPYVSTKDAAKGSGIGLYISKTIIEKRMNGRISVRNTGKGAEFRIDI